MAVMGQFDGSIRIVKINLKKDFMSHVTIHYHLQRRQLNIKQIIWHWAHFTNLNLNQMLQGQILKF